jgi:hypothetical protein
MPLTAKGQEIMSNMKQQYGTNKSEQVFYASKNAGKIAGVDSAPVGQVNKNVIGNFDTMVSAYSGK